MYSASSHDTLMTCPFEVSHRVEAQKLAGHVVKCQKNYRNVAKVTCPLNAEHKVHSSEIVHHLTVCSGRRQLEEQMYLKDEDHEKKYSVQHPDDIPTDENWDDDVVPSYDPTEYMSKNKVIRQKKVEPPAVRKAFRTEQRLHIQQLGGELPVPTLSCPETYGSSSGFVKPPSSTTSEQSDTSYNTVLRDQENVWTKVKNSRGRNIKKF